VNELTFLAEESPEGGFTARALGAAISTEADDLGALPEQIREAVLCPHDEGQSPKTIRLHLEKMAPAHPG